MFNISRMLRIKYSHEKDKIAYDEVLQKACEYAREKYVSYIRQSVHPNTESTEHMQLTIENQYAYPIRNTIYEFMKDHDLWIKKDNIKMKITITRAVLNLYDLNIRIFVEIPYLLCSFHKAINITLAENMFMGPRDNSFEDIWSLIGGV